VDTTTGAPGTGIGRTLRELIEAYGRAYLWAYGDVVSGAQHADGSTMTADDWRAEADRLHAELDGRLPAELAEPFIGTNRLAELLVPLNARRTDAIRLRHTLERAGYVIARREAVLLPARMTTTTERNGS